MSGKSCRGKEKVSLLSLIRSIVILESSILCPQIPIEDAYGKGRFKNEAPFSIIGVSAGVHLPAFLLTQRVCSSTISTSKYLLFMC